MIAVDTNVLIYAHRRETERHVEALRRLTVPAEGDSPWGLPVFCIAELVRLVPHLRVFTPPTDLRTALDFIDRLLESPSSRLLWPGQPYASTYRGVCETAEVRGNPAFDAQIVASCIEHGVRDLITANGDFARFTAMSPQFL